MSQQGNFDIVKDLCASQQKATVKELRNIAKALDIARFSTLSKTKLCQAIGEKLQSQISIINESEVEIPNGFSDPITQDIMYEPYILSDGTSMSKRSIDKFFASNQNVKGPESGEPLDKNVLIPNHNLRKAILEWIIENGQEENEPPEEEEPQAEEKKDIGGQFMNGIFWRDDSAPAPFQYEIKAPERVVSIRSIIQEEHLTTAQRRSISPAILWLEEHVAMLTNGEQVQRFTTAVRDQDHTFGLRHDRRDIVLFYEPENSKIVFLMSATSGNIVAKLTALNNSTFSVSESNDTRFPNKLRIKKSTLFENYIQSFVYGSGFF
jgi:hypothetical protein